MNPLMQPPLMPPGGPMGGPPMGMPPGMDMGMGGPPMGGPDPNSLSAMLANGPAGGAGMQPPGIDPNLLMAVIQALSGNTNPTPPSAGMGPPSLPVGM